MMYFLHHNVNSLLQHKIRLSSKNNEEKHNNILYTLQYKCDEDTYLSNSFGEEVDNNTGVSFIFSLKSFTLKRENSLSIPF